VAIVAAALLIPAGGCAAPNPTPIPEALVPETTVPVSTGASWTVLTTRPAPTPAPVAPVSAAPPPGDAAPRADPGTDPAGDNDEDGVLPGVEVPPAAPRLTPDPADYTTPAAVAAAYFAAWCHLSAGAAAATGVEQAIGWLTLDGWRDDQARAVAAPPPTPGVGVECGPVRVQAVAAAPRTESLVWVRIRARQVWVRGGAVLGDHLVSQVRRVVRAGDGRWLVDVRVTAG
jgi:hypothetical protein